MKDRITLIVLPVLMYFLVYGVYGIRINMAKMVELQMQLSWVVCLLGGSLIFLFIKNNLKKQKSV